jgi:L-amino acid N-acyltransferase YncA
MIHVFKNLWNSVLRYISALKLPSKKTNTRLLKERGEDLSAFIIREASIDDVPALAVLHAQTWAEIYWTTLNPPTAELRLKQWLQLFSEKDESWFCLLIQNADGKLVGFAKGQSYEHEDLPYYSGELNKIYLLNEYQRLGLGSRMLCEVANRFLKMGIMNMVLFGVPQNPSCYFHEAMGGERLYAFNGEFHGGYGWKDLEQVRTRCK